MRALLLAQDHLRSFGITAWQDAIIGDYGDMRDPGPAYAAAARDGSLTSRVVGALWWDREPRTGANRGLGGASGRT